MLACADIAAALVASLSLVIVGNGDAGQLAWSVGYLPAWIVVAKVLGLYDRDGRVLRHLTVEEAPMLVLLALIGTLGLSFFLGLTPAGRPEASRAVVIGALVAVSALLLRAASRWLWRTLTPLERVAFIGTVSNANVFRRKLELFPDTHMTIVALHEGLDTDGIGGDAAWTGTVDRIVVAPTALDEDQIRALLQIGRTEGLKLSLVPPSRGVFGTAVELTHLAELPVLEFNTSDISRSTLLLKRILDIAFSAVALIVLSPLFVVVAVAIKLDGRGPVLFSQLRAGQNARPFLMRKFRSMVVNAEELLQDLVPFDRLEEPVFKLRDDPRVTRVGRVLRRSSLDELPQLWNVLVGDMSLVGPRPEQLDLVERYSPDERLRLAVKPGVTGPMQVYGRGSLTLSERVAVEHDYIDNLSIGRDLRIIGMTFAVVLGRRGAH
jgi:exopolysaccharide biosynthesis polyprenyl glycosylphosphotransferase